MKIDIEKQINQSKLMDELLTANLITPTQNDGTSSLQGNTLYIADDTDQNAVQQIIDAHDPTPLPEPPTAAERIAQLEEENLMNMLALAELHGLILANGGGS